MNGVMSTIRTPKHYSLHHTIRTDNASSDIEEKNMPKFTPLSPGNEIKGQIMLAFIHCSERDQLLPFLEKYGLASIKPDQWYPEQPWVDLLNDLAEEKGAMFNFVSIG